jgi:hypothetical protein
VLMKKLIQMVGKLMENAVWNTYDYVVPFIYFKYWDLNKNKFRI